MVLGWVYRVRVAVLSLLTVGGTRVLVVCNQLGQLNIRIARVKSDLAGIWPHPRRHTESPFLLRGMRESVVIGDDASDYKPLFSTLKFSDVDIRYFNIHECHGGTWGHRCERILRPMSLNHPIRILWVNRHFVNQLLALARRDMSTVNYGKLNCFGGYVKDRRTSLYVGPFRDVQSLFRSFSSTSGSISSSPTSYGLNAGICTDYRLPDPPASWLVWPACWLHPFAPASLRAFESGTYRCHPRPGQ